MKTKYFYLTLMFFLASSFSIVSNATNKKNGILSKGVFSVSDSTKVNFSKGNLQYQASTKTWRFAKNQFDIVGELNSKISSTNEQWIDLFGWATSGYNNRLNDSLAINYVPWSTDSTRTFNVFNNFGYGPSANMIDVNLTRSSAKYDWGYNAISNGGNKVGLFRTLSKDEYLYLFVHRPNAAKLFAFASVNGVNGVIILPDEWVTLDNVSFIPSTSKGLSLDSVGLDAGLYYYSSEDSEYNYFMDNIYTIKQWQKFESNGAVFLPFSGFRWVTSYALGTNDFGSYWSSSSYDNSYAYFLNMENGSISPDYELGIKHLGFCVRLVRNIK